MGSTRAQMLAVVQNRVASRHEVAGKFDVFTRIEISVEAREMLLEISSRIECPRRKRLLVAQRSSDILIWPGFINIAYAAA
jgi:hypothetical protein